MDGLQIEEMYGQMKPLFEIDLCRNIVNATTIYI